MEENKLVVFEGKKVRRTLHRKEWYFVVLDLISVLTDTPNPSDYLKKMRKRDETLNEGWGQFVTPLKIETAGGTQTLNCVTTEGAFRIVQSIPSPKAEPFKLWLAKVGYERVQEIENPELAQQRMKELYRAKGYSEEWIEKRARGIAIRQELTDEWRQRDVEEGKEFAILTNEIAKATFGITPGEHKDLKGLGRQQLRDHMTELELIFSMLGEKSTTEIAKAKDARGFEENKHIAKKGGKIAGDARKALELEMGTLVTTAENYLEQPQKVKRIAHKLP